MLICPLIQMKYSFNYPLRNLKLIANLLQKKCVLS